MRASLRILRAALYWGLPPTILYLIFTRIDVGRLAELAARADRLLLLLGILVILPKIFAGGARWHLLARSYDCLRLPLRTSVAEYWISLTLGLVIPGSLGSDAYRVALSGAQTGRYLRGAFVVGIEKLAALFSSATLIAAVYPFVLSASPPASLTLALDTAYAVLGLGLAIPIAAAVARRHSWSRRLASGVVDKVVALANNVRAKVQGAPATTSEPDRRPAELLAAAFAPRLLASTLSLSLAIQVLGALQGQLFVQALGYDLPFVVNLLVAPLILLAISLPISFGGLGIREGAYILFYGAFGVPAETALLVSFCGLASVLLAHAVGGLLLLARGRSGPLLGSQEQRRCGGIPP